jgi:hypothetical protein
LRFIFFKLTQPLTVSITQLLYILKEENLKENHSPFPVVLRNPYINPSLRTLKIMRVYAKKLYIHELGFRTAVNCRDV